MDEFSDIMMQDKKGFATKVCLIAQKARAAGIHLVLAAQRPSVDIIDGPIKSNLPSRIVFRAASLPDSMTSLGEGGAEKLLGKGDCLYKTNGMLNVERVMGAYVSDEEMYEVIDYVTDNNEKYFDHNNWANIKSRVTPTSSSEDNGEVSDSAGESSNGGAMDPIYIKALRLGYNFGGLSVSFLQRKLAIGFPRAGKIIDYLTDNGYITADAISGKRQMIMTKEDFEEKFGAE
jgi:S-DNA-T family DNA segregation ATPase FtsK/SpoIIIE